MGKYMNKSKIAGDVTVMEVFSQPSNNVRTTRAAKTLALPAEEANPDVSFSYLQLRSRRLLKTALLKHQNKPDRPIGASKQSSKTKKSGRNSSSGRKTGSVLGFEGEGFGFEEDAGETVEAEADLGLKNLEFQVSRRGTRESTAGSRNPCSSTQYSSDTATNGIIQNNLQRAIPTAHEMEEFFASAEQQQQRSFIDKYNYDIVNDKPLDGRYEWVKLVL